MPLKGRRVGVYWRLFEDAQPEVVAACRHALGLLEEHGCEVRGCSLASHSWHSPVQANRTWNMACRRHTATDRNLCAMESPSISCAMEVLTRNQ